MARIKIDQEMVELENAGGKIVGISAMEKVDKDGLTLLLLRKGRFNWKVINSY